MPSCLDVVRVDLTSHQVKAFDVARDGDGPAAQVRVEYPLPRLGVILQEPAVEGYGLLGGVDAAFVHGLVALLLAPIFGRTLAHAVPHEREQSGCRPERGPCHFNICEVI